MCDVCWLMCCCLLLDVLHVGLFSCVDLFVMVNVQIIYSDWASSRLL